MRLYLDCSETLLPSTNLELRLAFFESISKVQNVPLTFQQPTREDFRFNDRGLYDHLVSRDSQFFAWNQNIRTARPVDASALAKSSLKILNNYSKVVRESCFYSIVVSAVFDTVNFIEESGSSYESIGLSYFCVDEQWTPKKFVENYIHESVHNALFIEDLVQGVFGQQKCLESVESGVVSSIRKTTRNYDLAFHAACVAVHLVDFFAALEMFERRDVLVRSTVHSIEELERVYEIQRCKGFSLLTSNGERILNELVGIAEGLNC